MKYFYANGCGLFPSVEHEGSLNGLIGMNLVCYDLHVVGLWEILGVPPLQQ